MREPDYSIFRAFAVILKETTVVWFSYKILCEMYDAKLCPKDVYFTIGGLPR